MILLNAVSFALRRLWNHRGLAVCLAGGLLAAVALVVAVPVYSDGIHYNLLHAALAKSAAASRRAPFHFVFHYVGSWHEPVDLEQYAPVDAFMQEELDQVIGLPPLGLARYVSTDNLQLYPQGARINRRQRLDLVKLAFLTGIEDQVRLVEGENSLSAAGAPDSGEALDVLVSLELANNLGLQVGEIYQLYQAVQAGGEPYRQPVRIAGLWVPGDPGSEFWNFYTPQSLEKKLLIPEAAFFGPVSASLPKAVNEAAWRVAFDGSPVHSENVPALLRRIDAAQIRAHALLPYTDLEASPAQALRQFRQDARSLAGLLFVFSAPILGLAFYFLGLVASMLVRRQRGEIAVLRSRGASRRWVALVYLLEWGFLSVFSLAAGLTLGLGIARLMGRTRSFLEFDLAGMGQALGRSAVAADFPLRLNASALGWGLAAAGLAVLFSLLPAWQAGKDTIVSYKQERARSRRKPLWQRMYLDLILLAPSLYGLYTLSTENGLVVLGRTFGNSFRSANPLQNPVLFLLPALFILSLSLLLLRLLPRLFSGLAWAAGRLPYPTPVLALRQLSRSAGASLGPFLLMVITLSLAGFVASMAHTLDRSLADSAYYAVGADLNLAEGGEYTGEAPQVPGGPNQPGSPGAGAQQPPASDEPAVWNFLPVTDHLALPGVQAAARVGRYEAEFLAGGKRAGGNLVGVDRVEFPGVAFFRSDFSPESLVGLMNRLASDPAALLVDRQTWERFNLNTGDPVEVRVAIDGETRPVALKVAGLLEYFPGLYQEEGPFFVANLDYLFETWGGLQPYEVWLRTTPDADPAAIVAGINNLGVAVISVQEARFQIEQAAANPGRQGVLGLLSAGFLAIAVLTVIGFLLYALLSLRDRFIQLGVLRAIGLSASQMGAALALEQFLLVLFGLAAGTAIGVLASWLFIPYLPITSGAHPGTPPYLVEIAWGDILRVYAVFGAMMLAGTAITLLSLARMMIFQAVKMGEAV